MFERFTSRARFAVTAAQETARGLSHGYVGTEHLVLGLSEGDGVGAVALRQLGFDRAQFERALLGEVGQDPTAPRGHIPFTPRSKQALETGLRQARAWNHDYIGTEHLIIGLLRDDGSLGTKLLAEQGITMDAVETVVLQLLERGGPHVPTQQPTEPRTVESEREQLVEAEASLTGSPGMEMARCPSCREPLADNLAADVIPSIGEVERVFVVAYCRCCGVTLTVLPDD